MKSTGKPAAITMCIGPAGDGNRVLPGECAVRLAKAGTVECALYRTYSGLLFELPTSRLIFFLERSVFFLNH